MSVLETLPTFVVRKRNVGACSPPRGRRRQEPPCEYSFAKSLPVLREVSAAERRKSPPEILGWEQRKNGYDSAHYPGHDDYAQFLEAPPGVPPKIEMGYHPSVCPFEFQTLLHTTTTGNRLKLLATDNASKQLNSRKNGYWRARAVADVKGSPNARSGRRRHTLMDQSSCASGHSHGPPGHAHQTITENTRNLE